MSRQNRRDFFAVAASIVAATPVAALAATSRGAPIEALWAQRLSLIDKIAAPGLQTPALDALCADLNLVEDAVMRTPISDRQTAMRRLELAAYDLDQGERTTAPRSVSDTMAEVIAFLGGVH